MLSVYLKLPISFQTYWYNVLRNTLTLLLKKNFPTECLVHSFATVFANSFFRTMNVPQIIARHPKNFSSLFFFFAHVFYLFIFNFKFFKNDFIVQYSCLPSSPPLLPPTPAKPTSLPCFYLPALVLSMCPL